MADEAAPDSGYILALLNQLGREFQTRDQLTRMFRRLRFLEEPVRIPAAYQGTATEIRTPAAAEINWRIVGTLQSGNRVLTVTPLSGDQDDREDANNKEDWTIGGRRRMQKDQNRDVDAMMTDAQVSDGTAWSKQLLRTDSWYEYPGRDTEEAAAEYLKRVKKWKMTAPFPIYYRDLDPLTVYPIESGNGIEAVIEVSYRNKRILDQMYPAKYINGKIMPREVGPPTAAVSDTMGIYSGSVFAPNQRFVEYWERPSRGRDWGWAVYMVGSDVVKVFKHKYRNVPYFRLYGQQTSSTNPGYAALPVLFPYYWGLIGLNALLTMKMNASFLWAYPIPYILTAADSPISPEMIMQQSQKLESGKMFRGMPGQQLGFLANPGTIVDLDETIRYLQNQLDRLLDPVLYGIGGAQQPGYTVSQLQNAALTVFRPLTDNQEMYYEDTTEHMWRCVELWGEEIFLNVPSKKRNAPRRFLSLGPKDVDGYYDNHWKIAALLPADKMARGQWAMQMYQGLGLPKRWAIEEGLQENNPEELVNERTIEDWLASGPVMTAQYLKFLQNAGFLPPSPQGPVQVGGETNAGVAATMPGGGQSSSGQPPATPAAPTQPLVRPNVPMRQRGRPAGVGRVQQPQPRRRPVGAQALR